MCVTLVFGLFGALFFCQRARYAVAMKSTAHSRFGFTLIEMMVVLSIIAILVMMAIPNTKGRLSRAQIEESLSLTEDFKSQVEAYYQMTGEWPENNESLHMPDPERIIGNYVVAVTLSQGALHIELGNKIGEGLTGRVLSLTPVFVPGSPKSPVSWVCGVSRVPDGMRPAGENLTDIEPIYLPNSCKY